MNIKSLLLLLPFVLPLPAWAEQDDFMFEDPFGEEEATLPLGTIWEIDFTRELKLDVLYVNADNFRFGKYNGLDEQGAYLAASFDVISRPLMEDGQDTRYWTLSVDNLGLSTSDIKFAFGRQGDYGFTLDLSNLRTVGNDTGVTPFRGSSVLALPDSWIPSLTTSGMTAVSSFRQFDPDLERSSLKASFNKLFGNNWNIEANYGYEQKKGEKLIGAAFYLDAANPHAALLPEPVDYTTIEFDFAAGYEGQDLQLALNYRLSSFDNQANEEGALTWQNPYANVFGTEVDYPNGSGAIGLAPDHRFQQVRATGTYRITSGIRLQFDGTYGKTEYKDTLAPYTVNPGLVVSTALPVSKVDDLDTSTFNINLLTNPVRRVSLNFKYHYEERDNTTRRYPWLYVRGDAQNQPDALRAVFNNPQNTKREKYTAEGVWRLKNRTRFTLTYDFEKVNRSLVSVKETKEDRLTGVVKFYPIKRLAVRFEAALADRAASTYQWAESFLTTYTQEQISRIPANRRWSNHPLFRQSYLASRESNFAKFRITYQPIDSLNLILDGDYSYHDYDKTVLGLNTDSQAMVNFSGSYSPRDSINLFGWVNYGLYETDQTGRSFRGGIEKPANDIFTPLTQGSDPSRNWDVEEQAQITGAGAGLSWVIIQDKFDVSADYVYTRTTTKYEFGTGGATDILGVPLPDNDSMLHQFSLSANYHAGSNTTWQLNYDYYRTRPLDQLGTTITGQPFLSTNDWALDRLNPATLDKVLTLGRRSADEVINMISVSVTYRY
jgi:MtrB/PioB family decaheme-associated outer membrane protein